jgi:hypothetical protein
MSPDGELLAQPVANKLSMLQTSFSAGITKELMSGYGTFFTKKSLQHAERWRIAGSSPGRCGGRLIPGY